MAKPSAPVQWATNTNYATGAAVGTPTKVTPSAGQIQDGFVPVTAAIPQHMNYVLDALADWTAYLDNLPAEPAFLGANYTWTGTHIFNGTTSVPGTLTVGTLSCTTANLTTVNITGNISNPSGDVTITDPVTCNNSITATFFEATGGGFSTVSGDYAAGSGNFLGGSSNFQTATGYFKYGIARSVTAVLNPTDLSQDNNPTASEGFLTNYASPTTRNFWSNALASWSTRVMIPVGCTLTALSVAASESAGQAVTAEIRILNVSLGTLSTLGTVAINPGVITNYPIVFAPTLITDQMVVLLVFQAGAGSSTSGSPHIFAGGSFTYTANRPTHFEAVP